MAAADRTTDESSRGRVLRDAGGLPIAAGGTIRRGAVFRISGQLASAAELDELARAGVIGVVDLRGEDEDRSLVRAWAASNTVTYAHEPIPAASASQLADLALQAAAPEMVNQAMLDTYRYIVDQHGRQLANTLEFLSRGTPAGFGCAAGRDRTGILASLLYDLLGVADEEIVRAYAGHAPTPEQLRPMARERFELAPDEPLPPGLEALMTVRPEWIERTLEHIRAEHGDVLRYLLQNGLPADAPDSLRRLLIVPAAAPQM